MADPKEHERDALDPEELEQQNGEALPDREVMSTITFDPGPYPLEPTPPGE
jgi:hypothetical protein